jgi:hypothetical protein
MTGFITENDAEAIKEVYGEDVYQAVLNAPEGETFLGLLTKLGKI